MGALSQRTAAEIGVEPALVKGEEHHGPIFLLWSDCPFVGAQCARCSTIVWTNSRSDPVLTEPTPDGVPSFGPGYTAYHLSSIERFLGSIPPCPGCGNTSYDRFINNVQYPRAPDGFEFEGLTRAQVIICDPKEVRVWVHEHAI